MGKQKRPTTQWGWASQAHHSPIVFVVVSLDAHQALRFSWCITGHWKRHPILVATSLVALGLVPVMKLSGGRDSHLILNLHVAEKGPSYQRSIRHLYHSGNPLGQRPHIYFLLCHNLKAMDPFPLLSASSLGKGNLCMPSSDSPVFLKHWIWV